MNKIKAYWTIMQELFCAPFAYALGARAYTIHVRYANTDAFDPFTDVLINKNREEATPLNAIAKLDDFETAMYSVRPIDNVKISPIPFIDYLKNHFIEILIWAS